MEENRNLKKGETLMTKEEILQQSRKENENGDECYARQRDHAFRIGAIVVITLLCIIAFVEMAFTEDHRAYYGAFSVAWVMMGSVEFAKGIFAKRKFSMIIGALYGLMGISYFVVYLLKLLQVM